MNHVVNSDTKSRVTQDAMEWKAGYTDGLLGIKRTEPQSLIYLSGKLEGTSMRTQAKQLRERHQSSS